MNTAFVGTPGQSSYSLEKIAERLLKEIRRLQEQRAATCNESWLGMRTRTLEMYDDMLDRRRQLLAKIEWEIRSVNRARQPLHQD